MLEKIKKHAFWIGIACVSIIRVLLVLNLPIFAIAPAAVDDRLMVNMAYSLLKGEWLGNYNQFTLSKGMMFPLFLAMTHRIGISYITSTSLLYVFSSILMIICLKHIIRNKKILFCIFVALVFNPAMFSVQVIMRVYRNALTPAQVLLILSCCMQIYFQIKHNSKALAWSIAGRNQLSIFLSY